MRKTIAGLSMSALLTFAAHAASISTTLTVTGNASLSASGATVTSTSCNMTNIGACTLTATASITSTALAGPVTITITSGGTLTGTISLPLTILSGSSSSASSTIQITGGTGTYAGSTGSITGTGTGAIGATGAITLNFTGSGTINTSGGGTTAPVPTISAVLDAASYTSSVAQGSIFVVKGANLSASGFTENSGFPLQTTLGNVKVTFAPVAGGTSTDAYMIYLYNQGGVNQLAALLPSTVAAGNYNVTVTNNGTAGTPFSATVVKSKFGLITRDSTGSGLAVVQNYISASELDVDAYTTQTYGGVTLSASYPGQTLIAYGTGFGAATGADNTASAGYNFAANGHTVSVTVGGMSITPVYAGRTVGSAGLDQVNFVLPGNVPTGCAVSFQVTFDGVTSPATYLSISPGAGQPCVYSGYTTAQLAQFDQGASIYTGGFTIIQLAEAINEGTVNFNGKYDEIGGQFAQTSGFELTSSNLSGTVNTITQGSCTVTTSTLTGTGTVTGGLSTDLDAGTITLTGPSGSGVSGPLTKTATFAYTGPNGFEGTGLPTGFPAASITLQAGTYSLSGSGGAGIGPFNASVTLGAPLTVTGGLPTTVTRSSGLTVNFTGGNPNDQVILEGASSTTTSTTTLLCYALASAGTITAPASILNQMPASATGSLFLESGPFNTFTAPIVAGGTLTGVFGGFYGVSSGTVSYK